MQLLEGVGEEDTMGVISIREKGKYVRVCV